MQAYIFSQYGSSDLFDRQDIEKPVPKDDEVLIKVHAASVNAADWHVMRGAPFFVRLDVGFPKPKKVNILGCDVAGTVEAVGANVTEYQLGDAVFGDVSLAGYGAFAEYVAVPAHLLAHKPASVSFEDAAATPLAGITALQGWRAGNIQAGERVLVNGASGGVGSMAVQLAKYYGAEVTGVCSGRNVELVKSIGADAVIDYTQDDFTRQDTKYDLIFDAVGNRSAAAYARALAPNGRCVVVGFTTLAHMIGQVMILGNLVPWGEGKKVGAMGTAKSNGDDMRFLRDRLADSSLKPAIDRCYSFNEIPEAVTYLETGHARGKVVVQVI